MFQPLPTPKEMAYWDKLSIEQYGIHGEMLMENASREALKVLETLCGSLTGKKILLFAGSGNNGGDAFALSRHLNDCGAQCMLLHTRKLDQYTGETAYHIELTRKSEVQMYHVPDCDLISLSRPDIIVDGLLGTGFQGQLRDDYLNIVEYINGLRDNAFVLALDIPSGLNGYTGKASPTAVRAHATVTFGAAKIGLFLPEAQDFTGGLHIRTIGIPRSVPEKYPPQCCGLNDNVFEFLPVSDRLQHKGASGHLLILGGSQGLSGAPTLAALGALKSGIGLVTVACPRAISQEIKQGFPEIMTLPLGPGKNWTEAAFRELEAHLSRFNAVVFGPGLGREDGALEFLQTYLKECNLPTLLDADALFCLAQDTEIWSQLGKETILTPHPGEMSRLTGISTSEIQSNRIQIAQDFVSKNGCILVLKGAGTVIASPNKSLCISPFSCSNLAIGGSGDVLSGVIGSLKARSVPATEAACLGVYWHGCAGQYLQNNYPFRGNLAQEIAFALPEVSKERMIRKNENISK